MHPGRFSCCFSAQKENNWNDPEENHPTFEILSGNPLKPVQSHTPKFTPYTSKFYHKQSIRQSIPRATGQPLRWRDCPCFEVDGISAEVRIAVGPNQKKASVARGKKNRLRDANLREKEHPLKGLCSLECRRCCAPSRPHLTGEKTISRTISDD